MSSPNTKQKPGVRTAERARSGHSPKPPNRGLLIAAIVVGSVVLAGGVGLSGYLLWPQLGLSSASSDESDAVDSTPGDYGFDSRLDGLWDRCAAGDFAACDELYATSPEDSEYERFGATCGDRGSEKPGLCETLGGSTAPDVAEDSDPELDLLQAECAGGNFQACDDLFFVSDPGSQYEEFGATCGDRGSADGNCVIRFG